MHHGFAFVAPPSHLPAPKPKLSSEGPTRPLAVTKRRKVNTCTVKTSSIRSKDYEKGHADGLIVKRKWFRKARTGLLSISLSLSPSYIQSQILSSLSRHSKLFLIVPNKKKKSAALAAFEAMEAEASVEVEKSPEEIIAQRIADDPDPMGAWLNKARSPFNDIPFFTCSIFMRHSRPFSLLEFFLEFSPNASCHPISPGFNFL